MAGGNHASRGETSSAADQTEIDTLMRRFLAQSRGEIVERSPILDVDVVEMQSSAPRRDFDMATELLDRASLAFDLLINRCQTLEHGLDDVNERARARGVEQDEVIEQWKRLASGLKEQLDASAQAAEALKARGEAAEARAAAAEQRVRALERASAQAAAHAATADQLSTKLHDKVVAAFGIGSRAHPVLEAVATRAAAE